MSHQSLLSALTLARRRLGLFADRVRVFGEVVSTNDIVLAWAEDDGEEGLVAIADAQTGGRGRLGRTWASPPGAGIYMSVLLRPSPAMAPLVTIMAGVALADAIATATGLRVALKWPNDICLVDDSGLLRKLGGILTEAGASGQEVHHVVVGCGVNVTRAAYPPDVALRATSLEDALGHAPNPDDVVVESLAALAGRYAQLTRGAHRQILDAWRTHARLTLGRAVEWTDGGTVVHGTAESIDDSGALLVRTEGVIRRVIAGEVRWT